MTGGRERGERTTRDEEDILIRRWLRAADDVIDSGKKGGQRIAGMTRSPNKRTDSRSVPKGKTGTT